MRPARKLRRTLIASTVLFALGLAFVVGVNGYVVISARGETHDSVTAAPHAQAAIVLGAMVFPDGTPSPMLADRLQRGAELWRAGKVDRVLVSGDHGQWEYDEVTAMREELRRLGVPARVIFTDHAGFNTWASMVRARKVFRVQSAIVVTQKFHMARALYLARAAGLPAEGVTSDIQPYGRQQLKSEGRELLARVKAFKQGTTHSRVLLGPVVPITGEARASWGPKRPS